MIPGNFLRDNTDMAPKSRTIYCCECKTDVQARLTNGREVYPHREDLSALPFWRCPGCGCYVGCHHKTRARERPMGVIPTSEMRHLRKTLHGIIDPVWRSGTLSRAEVYARLSRGLRVQSFHTAETRDESELERAITVARGLFGG